MEQRLIDANKLVFELNDAQVEYDEFYKGLGKAKIIVENQPTVEPIKGEWVNKGSFIGLIDDYRCSVCNCKPPTKKVNVSWGWNLTNFCPNCGADMRGVRNEK